ncbi:MAG: carboxymethylenebutenolidase [Acidobacteria bacterium]|nr:MAG: carboxymethylenebutenolidase [Acidobacteriota bacterium]
MAGVTSKQEAMLETFREHMSAEMNGDIEGTMATMTDDPYVNHVPVMTGGTGREGVRRFYRDHLVGKFFPPDVQMTPVSRTVGEDRVIEELVVRFTHTTRVDWMLPGLQPSGKRVEIAVVVVVGFADGKIAYERIYWDQASVLTQLGLLDAERGLPVSGSESARKVLDPNFPSRVI